MHMDDMQGSAEEDDSERADGGASRQLGRTVAPFARPSEIAAAAQVDVQGGAEPRGHLRVPGQPQVHGRHSVSAGAAISQ